MSSPLLRFAPAIFAMMLFPGLASADTAPKDNVLSADKLADLMIRHVEMEMALRANSDPLLYAPRRSVRTEPAHPFSSRYEAVIEDGIFKSSIHGDITEDDMVRLPDGKDCSELGPWFRSLDLNRDFDTFFVEDGGRLRICYQSTGVWKVGRVGGKRSHIILQKD